MADEEVHPLVCTFTCRTYPRSVDGRIIHAYHVSMKKIQVLFPEPQMFRLREAAAREDRPISELIRRATESYLDKLPAGAAGSAPSDIPVFDGGETLVLPEQMREVAYTDRTGSPR